MALLALLSLLSFCAATLWQQGLLWRQEEVAVGFVAAGLEACNGLPKVFVHPFFHEEDAMQVVGHQL